MRLNTRVTGEKLERELASAIETHGSKSEAVRYALRQTYLSKEDRVDVDLPPKALAGYEALVAHADTNMLVELETAKSVVANEINLKKESVKTTVFTPLKAKGLLAVSQRVSSSFIELHTLDERKAESADASGVE